MELDADRPKSMKSDPKSTEIDCIALVATNPAMMKEADMPLIPWTQGAGDAMETDARRAQLLQGMTELWARTGVGAGPEPRGRPVSQRPPRLPPRGGEDERPERSRSRAQDGSPHSSLHLPQSDELLQGW